jgi:hypothetical protein
MKEMVRTVTDLIITDIRKSHSDNGFDLITAIILNRVDYDPRRLSLAKKKCDGLLVLESGTAEMELPSIGVRKGDLFIRMWAKSNHGLVAGKEIRL